MLYNEREEELWIASIGTAACELASLAKEVYAQAAHLSAESADGWVSPDGLKARISLNRTGRDLLAARHKLTAKLTVSQRVAGRNRTVSTQKVTFRAAKTKHGGHLTR